MLRWSEYAAVRFPQVTIVVSEALKDELRGRHRYGLIVVIPNGVEAPPSVPSASVENFGLSAGEYLLFVGRLVPEKGAHVLVDAMREDPTAQVAIVGGSRYTDAYIDSLKDGAGPNIRFLGFRYGNELNALYANAQAVVIPSLNEGFSMVSIEAMVRGKPVIASNIPALRERLQDRGYYFPPGDSRGLLKAIREVREDPQESGRRGAEGRPKALSEYSWDRVAQLTLSALERSFASGGAR
jgi:glycosyltransferase involved in cell wall biosynthesis